MQTHAGGDDDDEDDDDESPFDMSGYSYIGPMRPNDEVGPAGNRSFGSLPKKVREQIKQNMEASQTKNKNKLANQMMQFRELTEEVDIVGLERKLEVLEKFEDQNDAWERLLDEAWLDLQVLRKKRGQGEEAVMWMSNRFNDLQRQKK